ncbi:Os02g0121750 [Oryza sativa Japonica Group]|uniref:Os02g0121750 protein n=1 Tax=Oryza sativa subsp. japonica TaxID=39947 RepID=A0A0P0VEB1_ORYSJ|nr:hypothetical protein EE612_008536 [Oryza sativa]BAS76714.1 Os02g0121750 [Oryza sativa Japonica Group]
MTPTILAALSAACVKPAGKVVAGDDLLGLAEKHSRLSSSHSPAISRRTCSSASPAASPGFSLRYSSLYDPSNPSCIDLGTAQVIPESQDFCWAGDDRRDVINKLCCILAHIMP